MIFAAVPIKRLRDAKSRLASQLDQAERAALVRELLDRTVTVLRKSGSVARIAVVTPETDLGIQLGVERIDDGGDLNASLRAAVSWALESGARGLLIIPGDLPLLISEDVRELIRRAPATRGIAIAATHDGGTGAILLKPPDVLAPSFGAGSFARHIDLARSRELSVQVVLRPAFTHDLDRPEDLDLLQTEIPLSPAP